jgi:hypothetical protein
MGYFRQFDSFDPLNTVISDSHFFYEMSEVAERARFFLKSRSNDAIKEAACFIDFATGQYFKKQLNSEDDVDVSFSFFEDHVWAFKRCYQSYKLDEYPSFPNGKDYEYFAVLALWLLADCQRRIEQPNIRTMSDNMRRMIEDMKKLNPGSTYPHKIEKGYTDELTGLEDKLRSASGSAIKSMEALCYAEHLYQISQIESRFTNVVSNEIKRGVSENARKAAKIRHANTTHKVKLYATDLYMKERELFKSTKEAARCIEKDVIEYARSLDDRLLSGVSAHDQIYSWLREAKKYYGCAQP